LSYATKSEQIDLLQKVLAATDADAEEEQMTGVDWSTKKHKVQAFVFLASLTYFYCTDNVYCHYWIVDILKIGCVFHMISFMPLVIFYKAVTLYTYMSYCICT